jgi:ataxia telangiectasia mutated family protein
VIYVYIYCSSRTIIDDYLRHSVDFTELHKCPDKKYKSRQCRTYFHLAHYTDGLFKSYEERLSSNEWQAALRLRKYKSKELDTLMKRLKSSSKSEKTDYSVKIQELQKQLALDEEEAGKIQVCMCSLKYIKYASHDAFSQIFNTPIWSQTYPTSRS